MLPFGNSSLSHTTLQMIARSDPPATSRRAATENKLLDALETVLVEKGLRHLTLNAVVDEAGVGKPLLYRYFGNLEGLLAAWVERRGAGIARNPVTATETDDGTTDDAFLAEVARRMIDSANDLQQSPVLLEMLAEELTAESEISAPFEAARRQQSRPFVRAMLQDSRYTRADIRARVILSYAAINYLAMRSRRSPNFMGLRLDTEEGWQEAMDMIHELIVGRS